MSSYCENGCCKYEMKIYDRCVFTPRNKQKAGVFIYDSIGGKILLDQSRGNLWGPPKGSCESGEHIRNVHCVKLQKKLELDLEHIK